MTRDIGRSRCYRAEATAFGADWFDRNNKWPILTEEQATELHNRAAQYLLDTIGLKRPLPKLEFTNHRRSCWRGFTWTCYYVRRMLRASTVVHEVAHWGALGDGHGKTWQHMFGLLIRKFISSAVADKFANECQTAPIMRYASSSRRRWRLEERSLDASEADAEWRTSNRARKTIHNAAKLQMWRGDQWVDLLGRRAYRMVEVK